MEKLKEPDIVGKEIGISVINIETALKGRICSNATVSKLTG